MKLRQLQFVEAVAKTNSFSRAAELCHATQPTLSNAIAQLEEELEGRLFTRTTRKVDLTPFGDYMRPYIQAILDSSEELQKASLAYKNPAHKLLRIGFSPLVNAKLLNRILQPWRQSHADISIFFKECLLDDLEQRLANNTIDIAIIPQSRRAPDDSPFDHFVFYSDELYYLPRDNHADAPLVGPLLLANLPDVPIILTGAGCGLNGTLKKLFKQQGVKLQPYAGQAISYRAIEEWVELGIGAGILPATKLSLRKEQAISIHMSDGRPAVLTYNWMWNPANAEHPHMAELIEYIRLTVPALICGGTQSTN